ncbi:linear amide C-N hydrolase, partial [Glaesserella parasuis]
IHHSRKYQVMTNSPVFDQQLAIKDYWEQVGGVNMLPGTSRAADRFVRASFYIDAVPRDLSDDKAVASVLSVIRNASTPYGMKVEGQPQNSSTR